MVILWCGGLLLTEGSTLLNSWAGENNVSPLHIQVVDPISNRMILPDTFPLPGERTSTITFRACRGEFEPASFVLRVQDLDMTSVTLTAVDLRNMSGSAVIPSKHVDMKIVKPWFQSYYAWNEIGKSKPNDFRQRLVPELLLNDDALVRVDVSAERNYVRLEQGRGFSYAWVNKKVLAASKQVFSIIQEFPIRDAKTLQPFDLPRNTSKQVWVTIYVPRDTPSGMYFGDIEVRSSGVLQGKITLNFTVNTFELAEPKTTYSIYYRAVLNNERATIGSEYRTSVQMQEDLQDLLNHGVTNPTMYQPLSNIEQLGEALRLRQGLGMNTEPLYYLGVPTTASFLGNYAKEAEVNLRNVLSQINAIGKRYGYPSVYIYGKDEAKGAELVAQKRLWKIVHDLRGKVFVAGYDDAFELVGDSLDLLIHAKQPSALEAQKWHQRGRRVFNYANPQSGPENPYLFRLNYGIVLWANDYDGAMPYAYQHCFGSCWNDVDHPTYRDHNFTYPTSDGVIDTLAWEGFREAVDDVRYLETLENLLGDGSINSNPATDRAHLFLSELKATILLKQKDSGKYNQKMALDLDAIRAQAVSHIEALSSVR